MIPIYPFTVFQRTKKSINKLADKKPGENRELNNPAFPAITGFLNNDLSAPITHCQPGFC